MAKSSNRINQQYRPMVQRWNLVTDTTAGRTIGITLLAGYDYDFELDWGDGTVNQITSYNDADLTHIYATTGYKTITIHGLCEGLSMSPLHRTKITDVLCCGYTGLKSLRTAFYQCSSLQYIANESEWTKNVTDMEGMFFLAAGWTGLDFSNWDTRKVQNLRQFCANGTVLPDISKWNMTSVTDMYDMFPPNYDSPLNTINVSNVTNFELTFSGLNSFTQDLSTWDTSSATSMKDMFLSTDYNLDITRWNTSNVVTFEGMFDGNNTFNQDISGWDFSSVPNGSATAMANFLDNTAMSGANYDNLLIALDASGITGVTLGAANVTSTATSATARTNLGTKSWTLNDGGQV